MLWFAENRIAYAGGVGYPHPSARVEIRAGGSRVTGRPRFGNQFVRGVELARSPVPEGGESMSSSTSFSETHTCPGRASEPAHDVFSAVASRGYRPCRSGRDAGRRSRDCLARAATAATFMQSSVNVALIPSNAPPSSPGGLGVMPISSFVTGRPTDSFEKFSFKYVALNNITPATLASFDTVALIQVHTSDLSPAAKAALAQFVANGGKLIIHDSDEASLNDYSWLLPGPYSTKIGAGCNACGQALGTANIVENSGLISANPADPTYVSIPELLKYTDAVGDANLLVSDDPRWFASASGANAAKEAGAQVAYASNNGLIIYNGFDTDMIKPLASGPWLCVNAKNDVCPPNAHPSVDWLAEMWYAELNKSWGPATSTSPQAPPNGLPQTKPVSLNRDTAATQHGGPSLESYLRCQAEAVTTPAKPRETPPEGGPSGCVRQRPARAPRAGPSLAQRHADASAAYRQRSGKDRGDNKPALSPHQQGALSRLLGIRRS